MSSIPGQATAYMVGKLKIEELREKARDAARRPVRRSRRIHDMVLQGGPVPLDMLEQRVDDWIASVRAS